MSDKKLKLYESKIEIVVYSVGENEKEAAKEALEGFRETNINIEDFNISEVKFKNHPLDWDWDLDSIPWGAENTEKTLGDFLDKLPEFPSWLENRPQSKIT